MPTILVDLPAGRRALMKIPERQYRMRRFYIARAPVLRSVGAPAADVTRPRQDFVVAPTGEWGYRVSAAGVAAIEIWRAE